MGFFVLFKQKENMKYYLLFLFIWTLVFTSYAQEKFAHCKFLEEGQHSPQATLNDIAWLAGSWQGTAMGGETEEVWTQSKAGSMMGSFKLMADGKVVFYEFMTITEVDSSLMLKIKHFDKDLNGWEEKDESIDFKLVEKTPSMMFFNGLSFEKISEDQINIYVVIDHNGKKEEVKFPYHKDHQQ